MLPNWPVRDQASRPTCVAFSLVACREVRAFFQGHRKDDGPLPLSEQYLYWGAKKVDGLEDQPGTRIRNGAGVIMDQGVCEAVHWPYSPNTPPAGSGRHPNHHADDQNPSAGAHESARRYTHVADVRRPTAGEVRTALMRSNAVALALRILATLDTAGNQIGDNWTNDLTRRNGLVLDPLLHKHIRFDPNPLPGGHAVCVVGYHPARKAPGGGWFVIRNSWGQRWGETPLVTDGTPLEAGNGTVSAEYVNRYAVEMADLP